MSSKATPRNHTYPDATSGSKVAKKLRSETNKLTEAQRENLFQRGMQVIYGGTGTKQTAGSGR